VQLGSAAAQRHLASRCTRMAAMGVVAVLLVGCGDSATGFCEHQFREPLVQVVEAKDEVSGSPIGVLVVKEVRVGGYAADLRFLTASPSYGVRVEGDSLLCSVPCGFGTREGYYIITVSAAGYPDQDREFSARYRVFHGGCPSYNDGGIQITVELRKSSPPPVLKALP